MNDQLLAQLEQSVADIQTELGRVIDFRSFLLSLTDEEKLDLATIWLSGIAVQVINPGGGQPITFQDFNGLTLLNT